MSDLISRSELISIIESEYREYGDDYDIEQILGDIEDMPTAFDADKVIDQLGERSMLSRPMGMVPFKEAVEIIKRGGKE